VEELFIHSHVVDALLRKFKRSKEYSIDNTRARHGDTQTSVHPWVQELDLRSSRFVSATDKAVELVNSFGRVNGEDQYSSQYDLL
jgi:hypothetical protein